MTNHANKFSESEKVEIINKLANGFSAKQACHLYGIDEKLIQSWQIQFPGGQISYSERIRLMELEMAQLKKRVSELSINSINFNNSI